jgi:hypothetical protein
MENDKDAFTVSLLLNSLRKSFAVIVKLWRRKFNLQSSVEPVEVSRRYTVRIFLQSQEMRSQSA